MLTANPAPDHYWLLSSNSGVSIPTGYRVSVTLPEESDQDRKVSLDVLVERAIVAAAGNRSVYFDGDLLEELHATCDAELFERLELPTKHGQEAFGRSPVLSFTDYGALVDREEFPIRAR